MCQAQSPCPAALGDADWHGWKVPPRLCLLTLSRDQLPDRSCCPHTSTSMVQAGGKKTLLCFSLGVLNWRQSYPPTPDQHPPEVPWSPFLAGACQQVSWMNFSLLWLQFPWCYLLLGPHPLTGTFLLSWVFCSSCWLADHMLIGPVIKCPVSHHLGPPPESPWHMELTSVLAPLQDLLGLVSLANLSSSPAAIHTHPGQWWASYHQGSLPTLRPTGHRSLSFILPRPSTLHAYICPDYSYCSWHEIQCPPPPLPTPIPLSMSENPFQIPALPFRGYWFGQTFWAFPG